MSVGTMPESTLRIMLVEDDRLHAFLAMRALDQALPGRSVLHFENGEEVLAYLEEQGLPEEDGAMPLLLLDLKMCRVGGLEVLRHIRSQDIPQPPVVILTTSDNPAEREEAMALGANDFFTKPLDDDKLARIGELLEQ